MPKYTLIFKVPEEQSEFNVACNGGKYLTVLTELDNWLRDIMKYGEEGDQVLTAELVRERLYELLREQSIDLYE
jgi:hypothetical protein